MGATERYHLSTRHRYSMYAVQIYCLRTVLLYLRRSLGIDPPFHIWLYRLLSRALLKAFSEPGSFYKDFLNPQTSVIFLAFRLRKKKTFNWTRMLSQDFRWKRVENTELFLKGLKRTLTQE